MRLGLLLELYPVGLPIFIVTLLLTTLQLAEQTETKFVHKIVRNIAIPVIAGAGAGLAGGVVAGVVTGSHKNHPYSLAPPSNYYTYHQLYSQRPAMLQSLRAVLRYSIENGRRSLHRLANPAVYTYKEEPHIECKVVSSQAENFDLPGTGHNENSPHETALHGDDDTHVDNSAANHNEKYPLSDYHQNEKLDDDEHFSDRDFLKRQQSRKSRQQTKAQKANAVKKT